MFEKDQIVLIDTNVVLEAHRASCWNAIANHFKLATVEKIIEETQNGFQNRSPEQTIDEASLRKSFHHIEVISDKARADFALAHPDVTLDPGERDLIIYAKSIPVKSVWLLNSPDMAAVRFSHQSGWLDRLVSLEEMAKHIQARTSCNFKDNYTSNWLSIRKARLILG